MKVRVILAFESYSVGQILEPTGVWRDHLIRCGYVEPVVDESPAVAIEPEAKARRKRSVKDAISESV